MRKTVNILGMTVLLIVMVVTVLTYLAPYFGWQGLYKGLIPEFLNTANGFFLGLVVPTVIFTALYVRTVLKVLKEEKTQELGEITNK